MTDRPLRQLTMLLHPFPPEKVHANPSGFGSYVSHPVVEQRILDVLGPIDFGITQVVRGDTKDGKLQGVVVGVLAAMTATIDGRSVTVTEAGDCEAPGNWPHDGARLKDASSDAYKRCAMRIGVGLHLWAQDDFYLGKKLLDQDQAASLPTETDR